MSSWHRRRLNWCVTKLRGETRQTKIVTSHIALQSAARETVIFDLLRHKKGAEIRDHECWRWRRLSESQPIVPNCAYHPFVQPQTDLERLGMDRLVPWTLITLYLDTVVSQSDLHRRQELSHMGFLRSVFAVTTWSLWPYSHCLQNHNKPHCIAVIRMLDGDTIPLFTSAWNHMQLSRRCRIINSEAVVRSCGR